MAASAPVHGGAGFGGAKRLTPPVEAPNGTPRYSIIPSTRAPRITPPETLVAGPSSAPARPAAEQLTTPKIETTTATNHRNGLTRWDLPTLNGMRTLLHT